LWPGICAAIKGIKLGKTVFCAALDLTDNQTTKMFKSPGNDRSCKIFFSVATASILPALTYAGTDNGDGNGG